MGNKIYYLNDTAQILYLCDHGAMHKWFRLKWLSDIAMIYAKNGSLDWLALLKMSELFGTTRVIHQTALLLNWIYGIQLDNVFENLISKENKSVFLAKQAMNAIVDRSYSVERSLEGLKKTKYIVMLKPTVSYTEILRVSLASPGDFFQIRLKDNFFWLYVPLRPLLWLWRRFVKKSEV
jgi:hypothetical protein